MRLRNIAMMTTLCASTLTSAAFAQTAGTAEPADCAACGDSAAAGVSVFPLQPGDGVALGQVVFETEAGALTSAWGRVEVDPLAIREALGESAGFVNVRVDGAWVALNIPVDLAPSDTFPRVVADALAAGAAGGRFAVAGAGTDDGGALPVVVYFDLGSTKARRALAATVVFSTEPLMQAADFENLGSLPASKFMVSKVTQTISNGIDDIDAPGPGGLPPPPQNPSIQLPEPLEGYWVVNLPNPVNVQSAHNQCVPVAAANALLYMRETFSASHGFQAPHSAGRGWRDSGSFSLAEELDERMLRPVVDQCQGSGTGYCPDFNGDSSLYAGVANYLAEFNDADDLTLRAQGSQDDGCFGGMAVDAVLDGPEVTFDWLCDRIQDGAGVTLTFERSNAQGEVTSAHAIRVHACGESGGRQFIRVLNDTRQDRDDDNDVCTLRDGLENQLVYLEDLDNDGRLNYGDNTRFEVVQAMAIVLAP